MGECQEQSHFTAAEKVAFQQQARIHQLEARVRELEGALRKIADWDFMDLDYRNAQDAARAALRTDHQEMGAVRGTVNKRRS